jgi:polyphenol oxidase
MISWEAPGGRYAVAFTTREGGVSEGEFASLNLGSRGDDPDRVSENRRRACTALGLDSSRLAVNRQRHSTRVHKATAGGREDPGDGLWTDEPGVPLLALTADCVPIALVNLTDRPALAVLHAGWRGLAEGIVEVGVDALGAGEKAAIIGPAIGPCCYEVGPEVSARFEPELTREGNLDLWEASARALRRAGVARVERVDLCTLCHPALFFSHRRSGFRRGVQGVIGALRD